MAATTPVSLPAGHVPTAAEIATYRTAIMEMQPGPVMASDPTAGTTASATYTATLGGVAAPLSVSFVAAKTAHVVTVGALITQQTSGPWNQHMAPVVTGAGFAAYGPNDADAAMGQMTNNNVGAYVEKSTVVTGLTIGNTYTVTPQYKAGSGITCTFANRRIVVHL